MQGNLNRLKTPNFKKGGNLDDENNQKRFYRPRPKGQKHNPEWSMKTYQVHFWHYHAMSVNYDQEMFI